MIVAVMTMDSIYLFDTEHSDPIWSVKGLHYGTLTDVSWSCDGLRLIVTSTDGFCSLIDLCPEDLLSHPLPDQSTYKPQLKPTSLGNTMDVPSSEPDILARPATVTVNQLIPKKRSLLSDHAI